MLKNALVSWTLCNPVYYDDWPKIRNQQHLGMTDWRVSIIQTARVSASDHNSWHTLQTLVKDMSNLWSSSHLTFSRGENDALLAVAHHMLGQKWEKIYEAHGMIFGLSWIFITWSSSPGSKHSFGLNAYIPIEKPLLINANASWAD
jgi:hypothetical protein